MVNLIPWKKKNLVNVRRAGGAGELSQPAYDDDLYPFAHFRREFDQLLDRFWDDWGASNGRSSGNWSLDIEDKEDEYLLHADLPGFEPDDIDVSVSGNVLTVRAEHKSEQNDKHGSSYRYGQFHETLTLPHGVLSDKIDARYHSGVLEVHLPKSEECKAKRIAVKST